MTNEWTETERLGTELEVVAEHDLRPLLDAIRSSVAIIRESLDDGRYTLWVELDPTEADLDDAVRRYVDLIESLPPHLRTLWDTSIDRCFNTGVQAGTTPGAYSVVLSAHSMARAARVDARHQFTIYAAHPEPDSVSGRLSPSVLTVESALDGAVSERFLADVVRMLDCKAKQSGATLEEVARGDLAWAGRLRADPAQLATFAGEIGVHRAQLVPNDSKTGRVVTAKVVVNITPRTGLPTSAGIVKTYNYPARKVTVHATGESLDLDIERDRSEDCRIESPSVSRRVETPAEAMLTDHSNVTTPPKPRPNGLDSPVTRKVMKWISAAQVAAFRATNGRIGSTWRIGAAFRKPVPVLLLQHRGRKSGKEFATPLLYLDSGSDFVVVASQGGLPENPQWYHNLVAHPDTAVELKGRGVVAVRARTADAGERARLWPRLVELYSDFTDYQSWTQREIPVVILSPC